MSRRGSPTLKLSIFRTLLTSPSPLFPIMHSGGEVNFRRRGSKFSLPLSHRHQNPSCNLEGSEVYKGRCPFSFRLTPPPSPPPHTHACVKPLIHPWVEVKFVYPANDSRSGDKFPKKLWCCVGGGYNKMIWFYQLNWKCELATIKVSKEDILSVSTRGLTFQMLA